MHRKLSLALLLSLVAAAAAQPDRASEARASASFEAARRAGPPALRAFLLRMPKGADLHMHLSGAVYAETFLRDAAADHLCADPVEHNFSKGPVCAPPLVPAADLAQSQKLYDGFIDAFSMRGFVASSGTDGHDQFFSTFGRFSMPSKHDGEWLDEIATRAATQNEQYLEVMSTPDSSRAYALGKAAGWPVPTAIRSGSDSSALLPPDGTSRAELTALRNKLLAGGLRDEATADGKELAAELAERATIERCGTPGAAPACTVTIRFLFQVLRSNPPEKVFAQTLLAFEMAARVGGDVVGINFVQPEDAFLAMSEYHRQMEMLDFLHSMYPGVHVSLHAGELAAGMVPPAGLRSHIREAVELGHAERIGHGVDVMEETDAETLLAELAAKHVMVEINLTSNDVILGISGVNHPLPDYRAAHVPVALSTDDEGVSRIDLTHEYVRAAVEHNLSYLDLKQMARTSLEHAFLPGGSLWQTPDSFLRSTAACAGQPPGGAKPAAACAAFLEGSEHARQQWELERRFHQFEASLRPPALHSSRSSHP